MGVVSEKEFQFQRLYLSPLLEHPLVVEEAACQCQFVDGGGHGVDFYFEIPLKSFGSVCDVSRLYTMFFKKIIK